MFGILCKKDGDPKTTLPIVKEEGEAMTVWETLDGAREFAKIHILCQVSEVLFIDLINNKIFWFEE